MKRKNGETLAYDRSRGRMEASTIEHGRAEAMMRNRKETSSTESLELENADVCDRFGADLWLWVLVSREYKTERA